MLLLDIHSLRDNHDLDEEGNVPRDIGCGRWPPV